MHHSFNYQPGFSLSRRFRLKAIGQFFAACCLLLASNAWAISTPTTDIAGNNLTGVPYDLGQTYIFVVAPTVTSLTPTSGPTAGNTAVTITGTSFTGATAVTIGGAAATGITVVNDTTITCTTPAGSAGSASVLVTTPGGTNSANTLYTYTAAPTVTSISPTSGSTAGNTAVTISGTSFTGATAVTIGGAAATSVVVVNATTITCNTPAGSLGTASVLVTTPAGTNAANTLYTYAVPADMPATISGGVLTLDGSNSANPANTTLSINGLYLEIYDPSRTIGAGPGMIQDDSHTIRVLLTSITSLVINGTPEADTFTLDYGNVGTSNFPPNITVNGGLPNTAPGDTLAFQGTGTIDGTYDTSSMGSGSIDLSAAGYSGTVNFTGMEPIDFTGMALNNFIVNVDNAGVFANANLITNVASSDAGVNTIVSFLLPPFSAPTASGLEYVKFGTVNGSLTVNGASTDNNYFQLVSLGTQMLGDFTVASTGLGADVIEINNTTFTVPGLNKNLSLTASFIGIGRLNVAPGSDQPGVISCSGNITLVANGDSSVTQPLWDTTAPVVSGVWGTQPTYFIGGAAPALNVEILRGTIQVRGNISKTAGNDATLTMQARGTITFPSTTAAPSTGQVTSTNNKLNVVLQSDTDSTNAGSVLLMSRSQITTNGGYLTIGGGANPATSPAMGTVGQSTSAAGVTLQSATLTTSGGNISILGQGANSQGSGEGVSTSVFAGTVDTLIDSGTGTLSMTGTGGTGSSASLGGVVLVGQSTLAVRIHSSTGNITINGTDVGTGGGFSSGVQLGTNSEIKSTGNANISITGSSAATYSTSIADINVAPASPTSATVSTVAGNVTFIGDTMNLAGSTGTKTFSTSGSGRFTVKQRTPGKNIDLGATDTTSLLGLSTTELGTISATTLQIGDTNSGTINISAVLDPTTFTTLALANNTTIAATGGFTSTISSATNYTNMTVTGTVNINPSATLTFASGSGFVPSAGQDFKILDNDGTDAITGNFTGLTEGTTLPNFLSSGITEGVTYAGGTGNDLVIGVAPTISSSTGAVLINATTLIITGTGFSTTPGNNVVTLNNGALGTVTAATATQLTVTITTPPASPGPLTAVVNNGISSGTPVQVASIVPLPTVTLTSTSLPFNATTVTITGTGFDGTTPLNNTVVFNDGATGTVTASTTTSLTVTFGTPPSAVGSLTAVVTVFGGSSGTPTQVATITPVVTSSTASLAANATTITINGFGFDSTTPSNNAVVFNDSATGTVTSATSTSLTVTFGVKPASVGSLTAVVTTDTVSSGSAVQVASIIPVITPSSANLAANASGISISGFAFDSNKLNDGVTFSGAGTGPGTVTAASSTGLGVNLPSSLIAGVLNATMTSDGVSSGTAVQVATITPVVTSSTASLAANATTVTINGAGFDPTAAHNTVTFNDGAVGTVTSATNSSLTVTFGTNPTSAGSLTAIVTTNSVSSGSAVQVASVIPVVTSSTASIQTTDTTVTINGFGFDPNSANNSVTLNLSATVSSITSTPTQIVVTFGTKPTVGNLTAVVTSNSQSSGSAVQVATVSTLSITSSTTNLVQSSTTLTIAGTGFSTTAGNNTVTFNNGAVGHVTSSTSTSLSVTFDTKATSLGALNATVTVAAVGTTGPTQVATVVAGAASKLVVISQPTNTVSGAVISPAVTVQIQDANGFLTTSTANVTLSLNGIGTLSGTKTVAAVAGVATFNTLSVDKAATGYTLVPSSPGLSTVFSNSFNITPGAPAKLVVITQPTDTVSATAISPAVTVQIQDAAGNLTTSTASVTMAIGTNPSSGTLSGTTTVAAVAGVATFSTLQIDKAGTGYTLSATSGVLTSSTSNTFNITAGAPAKLAVTTQPTNTVAGVAISPAVTVQIQDAAGNLTTSTAGVVMAIGTNPGGGTLSGTTTVNAVAGTATFSTLSINKTAVGYTLSATSGGLTAATSSTFNITPAAAASLALSAPSTATAGTAFSVSVTAKDAFGNIATGYSGTVHFTATDASAVLPANSTLTSGAGSFNVTFDTVGVQTVTATDTVASSVNGTSGSVTVSAGSATHFAVSAPANGAAGVPFNFSVTALDAHNNTATGYTGTVHFTGGDPAATLPADYTFVPADAGIHVFSNGASLPTAGLRTLTAADTVTSSISGASGVITVSATITGASRSATFLDTTQADFQGGVATSLDLTGSPGDAVLGAAGPNQSNTMVGTSGVGITVTTWGGQTFTPSVSGQLTKASLHLFASGATGTTPNLTLSLRATSGGLPTGADLASTTITGFNNGSDVKYTATFSSPATVTAGTQYALIIRPTANPSPGTYALTRSGTPTMGSDVYSGGTRVSGATSGTVWSIPLTGGVSTDAGFEIFIGSSGASNADLISSVKDSNPGTLTTAWQSLSWTSSVATGGVLQFQVAGSSSSSGPFAFVGPDGTAATYYTTSGASLSQFNGSRYLKYRAYFTGSSNGSVTLSDVTLAASVEPTVTQTTTSQTAAASTVIITGTGFDTTPLNNQVTLNNGASGTVTSATSTQLTVTLSTPPNALGALTAVVTSDSISSGAPVQVATIIPGPADHLAFGVSPSSTVAGVVISPSVTVQILDASGLLTTSTANVTLGIGTNPGSAVLNGTTTVAAINGVATFSNLSINKTGTGYTLGATSGGLTVATSGTFNITPAAVASLSLTAPGTATAGVAFSTTLTALDQFGNTVTGYLGTVQFTTTDSGVSVVVPGSYTFVPGDSGVHTFASGVTLVTAGNQTVSATDTLSITGTTGSIAVSAAAASHLAVSAASTATAGVAINSSVTALDPYGNTAISYTGTVHFTSTDVGASVVLPGNYTFLPGDSGVHVFSGALTFVTAGSQTLTATDTISGSITGTSTGTVVSAAAATHLVVTAPGTATVGVAVSATVTAQDQYGNTATSYLGTVNFTKTDSGTGSAVPANYNFVAGDNGTHTFTGGVTLVTAGSQTVTATDTVTGTITGTSGNITVSPAATSHFVVTAPTTAGPGTPITVTLTAEDAFNNITPAYTGTVAFTLSDTAGGTAVPANYTFISGDAGLHTFTNGVTFATPGVQTVTATDTVSASITGFATVNVGTLNPTPTQLVPTNPVTGLPLPPGSLYPVISQSGTIEVRVSIKNTTAFPINGFRLNVDYSAYLPFHSLVLYNRTSPSNYSEPAHIDYIDYLYPVAVNATVSVKLQFYTTSRTLPNPFSPTLTVTTLATSEVPSTDGSGVQPRIRMLPPNNNILLEWDSTAGQWYRIKYSSDLVNWFDCPVPVQGVANRTQWVDDGPPFTNVPPASVGARYYKLNTIAAPTGP